MAREEIRTVDRLARLRTLVASGRRPPVLDLSHLRPSIRLGRSEALRAIGGRRAIDFPRMSGPAVAVVRHLTRGLPKGGSLQGSPATCLAC